MTPIFRVLYWIYRMFSSARHWSRRRLTAAGWMVLVSFFVSLTMSVDTENTVVYQSFPLLLSMLAIGIAFAGFFRARLSATRLLPRFATVGRPLYYRVLVKNLTSRTQEGLVLLDDLVDPRPNYQEWRAVQLADDKKFRSFRFDQRRRSNPFLLAKVKDAAVPPIRPNEEAAVNVELTPLRRGPVRFAGVTFGRPDPLGLFRAFANVPLPQTVLVLPKRYLVPPVALPGTLKYQEGGVALASNIGRSDEFVSLRDYRRGDPYRHIHWRSWAKAGKPIVKEFEDEFFVRHALVLDTFAEDPRGDAFEEAISVAASFACTLGTQESLLDLLFVGSQAFCFTAGRGLAHSDQMLEILASVQASVDKPFGDLSKLVLEHSATVSGCVLVFLSWDEQRRALVDKLRLLGVPLLVLVVVEGGENTKLDPGPMRDQPAQFRVLEAGKIEEALAAL